MAQYSKSRDSKQKPQKNDDIYEVNMLATKNGEIVTTDNPLPVTLGSDTITITGDVNVGTTVEISNDEGSPIPTHTHLFDENEDEYTDSNPFTIDGTVTALQGTDPWTVDGTIELGATSLSALENINATVSGTVSVDNFPATQTVDGTVNIGTLPEIEIKNDTGNPIPVTIGGDVSLNIDSDNPLPVIGTTTNPWGRQVLTVDDDTVQHTSKNRRKVSTFEVTDFGTFKTGKDTRIWDEKITGTGSSTFEQYLGMVKLEVGSDAGDEVIRQTKRVQRYLPGRQNEVSMAVIFGSPTTGVRRRFGLFDEEDGAYFEDGGDGTYYVVCRRNTASGPVEERVARENWNVDKLDGTGPTGIVADPNNIQLMVIEYEWYGAGQVEFNFVIGNNKIPVHQFDHANLIDTTWASTASLPVRIELTNVTGAAGTHTLYQGSHSFATEGTTTLLGRQRAISNAITGKTLSSANTFYPMVAIRLKSTALNSVVIPDVYTGATRDNTSVFIRVIEGATVTGGTWVSYEDESPVEYNITATGYTNGNTLDTIFVSSGNMGHQLSFPERSITQIQRETTTTLGDTSSTFLIAIASTGSNKAGWASLGWIEVR